MWSIIASIIMGVGTAAYSANRQRKAQEQAEQNSLYQRLTIEGQAPQLLDMGQGVGDQPVIGSDISEALGNLRYNPEASFTQMLQSGDVQQQELPPEVLEQLMMSQQAQFASGGPVGRPEDTYYFSVEDIQGMMQEPDPMMQAVGAGLMGQMPPGGGMVPATPGQIQMMANGGQPLYRDMGGQTNLMTTEASDLGSGYDEIVMLESSDSDDNELVEGIDYFMIDGEMVWPWELEEREQARVNEEMSSGEFGSMISGLEKPKFGPGKRKKGSKPVFSAAQRYDMDRMIDAARKSGRTITPTDRENLEIFLKPLNFMEEVPIRRQEGGITAVRKLNRGY